MREREREREREGEISSTRRYTVKKQTHTSLMVASHAGNLFEDPANRF